MMCRSGDEPGHVRPAVTFGEGSDHLELAIEGRHDPRDPILGFLLQKSSLLHGLHRVIEKRQEVLLLFIGQPGFEEGTNQRTDVA